jgi:hypothetical protein
VTNRKPVEPAPGPWKITPEGSTIFLLSAPNAKACAGM